MIDVQALFLTTLTMLSILFMGFGLCFFFISEGKQIPTFKTMLVTLPCIIISVLILGIIMNMQSI